MPAQARTAARRWARDRRASRREASGVLLDPLPFPPLPTEQDAGSVKQSVCSGFPQMDFGVPVTWRIPAVVPAAVLPPSVSGMVSGGAWPRPTWSLPCVFQASSFSQHTKTLVSAKITGLTDVLQC